MGEDERTVPNDLAPYRWTRRDLAAMASVAALALVAYANSLGNDYVYDDRPICLQDERTHNLNQIARIFTQGYWGASDTSLDGLEGRPRPLYRPVTLLSLAATHAVVGVNATVDRLINVALHAGVSAGLFALCMVMFRQRVMALLAGLIFAVHPVHVEAVVPIVGRSELLAAITAIVGTMLYVQDALKTGGRGLTWRYAAVLVLLLIGVFSKESAITTVGLVIGADVWLKARGAAECTSWKSYLGARLVHRYLGVFAVAACFMVARRLVLGQFFSSAEVIPLSQNVLMDAPLGPRLLTCLLVLAKYVHLMVVPYPLNYDYSGRAVDVQTTLWSGGVLAGVVCVAAMMVAIAASARRRGEVAAAILFFVITYSVASNVLVRIGTLMAERLIYLPSAGLCMLWGLLAGAAISRWGRTLRPLESLGVRLSGESAVVLLASAGMLSAFGVMTVRRNTVWQSNQVLYETDIRTQPLSHRCWLNLGLIYLNQGDSTRGLECLEKAKELAPNAYDILARMGWEYAQMGQPRKAIELLEEASAQRWRSETFTLWVRAQLYQELGEVDRAVQLYREALAIKPTHQVSLVNLAAIYANPESGTYYDPKKAYACALRAANLPRAQPQAHVALADACVKLGRNAEARQAIARGLMVLQAYRAKAQEIGKLSELAPVYNQLEASLRQLLAQVGSAATRAGTTPR